MRETVCADEKGRTMSNPPFNPTPTDYAIRDLKQLIYEFERDAKDGFYVTSSRETMRHNATRLRGILDKLEAEPKATR